MMTAAQSPMASRTPIRTAATNAQKPATAPSRLNASRGENKNRAMDAKQSRPVKAMASVTPTNSPTCAAVFSPAVRLRGVCSSAAAFVAPQIGHGHDSPTRDASTGNVYGQVEQVYRATAGAS
jgi:hypothetical protein